jgi:hypothetical protein
MQIFTTTEAKHFCSLFKNNTGASERSIKEYFYLNIRDSHSVLRENTQIFNEYRDCVLREIERNLFFTFSNYRRTLDLMIGSSSHWSFVTIYYACFYCARALLGIIGCYIFDKYVIDVRNGSFGHQELRIKKIGRRAHQEFTTYNGSHRIFWDLFYRAIIPLIPMVTPQQSISLNPINSDPVWLIERRNQINYDTWYALSLTKDFLNNFNKQNFPNSLPGNLQTEYGVLVSLIDTTVTFAKQFNISSKAIYNLNNINDLEKNIKTLIYKQKTPALVRKMKKFL